MLSNFGTTFQAHQNGLKAEYLISTNSILVLLLIRLEFSSEFFCFLKPNLDSVKCLGSKQYTGRLSLFSTALNKDSLS
jgi:hypothetical protein